MYGINSIKRLGFRLPQDNTQMTEYRALYWLLTDVTNTLRPSGHYVYHQFNIQQLYVLPTQCIYVIKIFIYQLMQKRVDLKEC